MLEQLAGDVAVFVGHVGLVGHEGCDMSTLSSPCPKLGMGKTEGEEGIDRKLTSARHDLQLVAVEDSERHGDDNGGWLPRYGGVL